MSPGSTVLFGAKFSTQDKRVLRKFARAISTRIAGGRAFTCLLTNDEELQRLNKDFLGHDHPTDVLSFPAANANGNLGEIAISVQRASAQAGEFGHPAVEEIRILMLHGLLHLTGMDHERDGGEMELAEQKWRAEFGLPSTLIRRASALRPRQ
jgi:probable rRNA maturation factor